MTNKDINIIAQNIQSTVVAEFIPSSKRAEHYQCEGDLEKEFIAQLEIQMYEYLKITNENDLILNLKKQLEKLNKYEFSDSEWKYFFESEIANVTHGIKEKTTTIQEDYIKILKCDNGTEKNIYLLDKVNIHNNYLQVINQYTTDE